MSNHALFINSFSAAMKFEGRDAKNMSAYQRYCDWCDRIGVKPAAFWNWLKIRVDGSFVERGA